VKCTRGWRRLGIFRVAAYSESVTPPVRVALVEDNAVFREALELLLGLRSDIEIVASIADGTLVVEQCKEHSPDVVVMDYRLPVLDGVQVTKALLEACPDVAVVCLTASANLREIDALHAAGAVACLTKDEQLDEIVAAIHRAAGRELAPAGD
jgi:DNA-binding NarL/FixJ family response regulator